MEANAGLVERLTTVGILAKVGKKLQAQQNVFVAVGAGLDFAVVVMMMMAIPTVSIVGMIRRPDGILPHGRIRRATTHIFSTCRSKEGTSDLPCSCHRKGCGTRSRRPLACACVTVSDITVRG